jgi:sugar phosphate permease
MHTDNKQWLTFAPISTSAATYFNTSETAINWLSTGFLFSFAVAAPLVIWTLHRTPKESILWASGLLLVGNWIRYAGTKASGGIFGVVMFGQMLTGLAQPFVLAAPTRYSDMWFTERGRVGATALASLANPFGGAVSPSHPINTVNPLTAYYSLPSSSTRSSALLTKSSWSCRSSQLCPAYPPSLSLQRLQRLPQRHQVCPGRPFSSR